MDLRELAPCTFMTAYADIDVDFQPAGTSGFRDLFQDADRFEVGRARARTSPRSTTSTASATPGPRRSPRLRCRNRAARAARRIALIRPSRPVLVSRLAAAHAPPPATLPPNADDYDPGIWTEEEFRAIRSGRITF